VAPDSLRVVQAESNSVTFASAATQEKSRNSPELLCDLAFGVWNLRLPQFDRISLRVMQAGEPAVKLARRFNTPAASSFAPRTASHHDRCHTNVRRNAPETTI